MMGETPSAPTGNAKPGNGTGATAAPAPPMKVSEALGEIVWLMSQSALHKGFFISDLEWMVMPPVLLGQFRLFHRPIEQPPAVPGAATQPQAGPAQQPIGVVLWAFVTEEIEQRLKTGAPKLRPQDWRSGDRLWVIEVIAPLGGHEAMVEDLKQNVFPERKLSFVRLGADGRKEVAVL